MASPERSFEANNNDETKIDLPDFYKEELADYVPADIEKELEQAEQVEHDRIRAEADKKIVDLGKFVKERDARIQEKTMAGQLIDVTRNDAKYVERMIAMGKGDQKSSAGSVLRGWLNRIFGK